MSAQTHTHTTAVIGRVPPLQSSVRSFTHAEKHAQPFTYSQRRDVTGARPVSMVAAAAAISPDAA
jgi:hypothetical protein